MQCWPAIAALVLILATRALAAEPRLEKFPVLTNGQGGYHSYRIPGIVVTPRGTLIAYGEARQARGDWAKIDLLALRSEDRGQTWSAPLVISEIDGPARLNPAAAKNKPRKLDELTNNNPVAIVDAQGTIHLLFCQEYMRAFYRRSDDDGRTFSKAVEITPAFDTIQSQYAWKVLAIGPGHGIQLSSGRLLAPVWLSTSEGANAHHPSVVTTLYSDDQGANWRLGEIVAGRDEGVVDPSESMAVELSDGRVMLNLRNESREHRRAVALSPDGAARWTTPRFDPQLIEPICMASLCRAPSPRPGEDAWLLFSNPYNLDRADGRPEPGKARDRKNLTVQLSQDSGQSWNIRKTIEAGNSGYSDLAVAPDGQVYCLYEQGPGHPTLAPGLVLARFPLDWLSAH